MVKQCRLHRRHSLQTVVQYVNHINWYVLAELSTHTHPRTKKIDMEKEPLPDKVHISPQMIRQLHYSNEQDSVN